MALRQEDRTEEQKEALRARFFTAQSKEIPEDIEQRKQYQSYFQADIRGIADYIDSAVADSREKSLALTHLEEALMWAGKAIFS